MEFLRSIKKVGAMNTQFDIKRFTDGLHVYIGSVITPLVKRIEELERQEATSLADCYRGSWRPHNKYARGSLVSHGSSLWLAMEHAAGKPGSSPAWRLILKAGRVP